MQTIHDITFDELYFQADHWTLILYQIEGVALAVSLPNIHLLTFMKFIDNIFDCQDYITTNQHKIFTLFAYSENIETWLWNNNAIPNQLDEIIIFCPSPEDNKGYWRDWTRRYTQKVKRVVTFDELEREALIFGMRYIDELSSRFKNNPDIFDLLRQNYKQICLALHKALENAANRQQ